MKTQQSIIFTDTLGVFTALHTGKPSKNVVRNRLIKAIVSAYAFKLTIVVCWVPGQSSILGNEIAGRNAAVAALRSGVDHQLVPYQDIKPLIRQRLRQQWQQEYGEQANNKLHVIKPHIGKYYTDKKRFH